MSLASSEYNIYDPAAPSVASSEAAMPRTGEKYQRWSRMRSQEGSSRYSGSPGGPGPAADDRTWRPAADDRRRARPRSASADFERGGRQVAGYSPARSSSARPASARSPDYNKFAIAGTELKTILQAVGQHCLDYNGGMQNAFHEMRADKDGNVRRADIRRFFKDHRVATRMADKFFDCIAEQYRGPISEMTNVEAAEAKMFERIKMKDVKGAFDAAVGQHLQKMDRAGGKQAGHHNVHGLLRPQHGEGSVISVPDHGSYGKIVNAERLRKIAKQMTGRAQGRFVDKYGVLNRMELQRIFESYGLAPEDANVLFDQLDGDDRNAEITFKELGAGINKFLKIPEPPRRKHRSEAPQSKSVFDGDTMTTICASVGGKAAQKFKSVQAAFRAIDLNGDGGLDRFEVRQFFRSYGAKTALADKFFDTMDVKREGQIDIREFKSQFAPFIQPGYHPPVPGENCKNSFKDERTAFLNQEQQTFRSAAGVKTGQGAPPPRSAKRSSNSSGSVCQDELRQNRFGRFDGVSTYQASFNETFHRKARSP